MEDNFTLAMKPTAPPQRKRALVEALIALATQVGLGETVNWYEVRAAIFLLYQDPVGPRDLRYVLKQVNNGEEIAATLEDWFIRAASEREDDAKAATRTAEKLLFPIQGLSTGLAGTTALGYALGTITSVATAPVTACLLVIAGAGTFGRWRLTKRADEATSDATGMRRMAVIAGEGKGK